EIAAGTASLRRAALVIGGGLRGRLEIRNSADAVRQSRQFPKKMREAGIDALGDDAVAVNEIFGLVVVKTRICAKEFGEVVEAALEFSGRDDLVHLRANAFHFGQANFVNLIRRQIRCGLPPDMEALTPGAVGHPP